MSDELVRQAMDHVQHARTRINSAMSCRIKSVRVDAEQAEVHLCDAWNTLVKLLPPSPIPGAIRRVRGGDKPPTKPLTFS